MDCKYDDYFIGTNGSAPNTLLWVEDDPDSLFDIQSNKLNFNSTSSSFKYANVISNWNFEADTDFDIQIDFDSFSCPTPSSGQQFVQFLSIRNSDESIETRICRANTSTKGNCYWCYGSSSDTTTSTTDSSGKFRITNVSGTIKVYYWSGTQWEWNGNTSGFTASESFTGEAIQAKLVFYMIISVSETFSGNFDNFIVNSGCPDKCWYNDNFTGSNGDPPDAAKWNESDTLDVLSIQSNKLEYDCQSTAGHVWGSAHAAWVFDADEDFDIRVKFSEASFPASVPAGDFYQIYMQCTDPTDDDRVLIRRGKESTYDAYTKYGAKSSGSPAVGNADISGELRVTYISGEMHFFYWDNNQWEWDGDTDGFEITVEDFTGDWVRVMVGGGKYSVGATDYSFSLDDFQVTFGCDNITYDSGESTLFLHGVPNERETGEPGTTAMIAASSVEQESVVGGADLFGILGMEGAASVRETGLGGLTGIIAATSVDRASQVGDVSLTAILEAYSVLSRADIGQAELLAILEVTSVESVRGVGEPILSIVELIQILGSVQPKNAVGIAALILLSLYPEGYVAPTVSVDIDLSEIALTVEIG